MRTFRWVSSARSDAGCVRELNEDAFLARDDFGLWLVMDGMGGHAHGDVASQLVLQAFETLERPTSMEQLDSDVETRLQQANQAILDERARDGVDRMMGTTVVAFLAHGEHWVCYWAGDSRAYLLRDGELARLTHDHSIVQELVDSGLISDQEALSHPASNQITNAVGVNQDVVLARIHAPLRDGDLVLLCTDGLYHELSEAELSRLIRHRNPRSGVDQLVDQALDRGARDNVTAVMISFEENTLVGQSATR
jgi:serine/threonine protein phosphatase PrpC